MRQHTNKMTLLTILLTLVSAAQAQTPAAGQKLATTCAACHGEKGISNNDLWPNLAGQKKDYIVKQLTAFQNGDRKDPMMSPMAGTLSSEDIQNVAAYFSSLKTNP